MNVRDAVTSFPTNPKIGFIGLGNMGAALAMRLLDPDLMVYDPDQTAMKPFVDGGAIAALIWRQWRGNAILFLPACQPRWLLRQCCLVITAWQAI